MMVNYFLSEGSCLAKKGEGYDKGWMRIVGKETKEFKTFAEITSFDQIVWID